MAEIRVEEKRGGLGWLWMVLLLALAALAAWYFLAGPDRDVAEPDPVVNPTPASPTAAPTLPHHRPAEAMVFRRA